MLVKERKRESLGESFPELAREFHPTRNGDLTPDSITAGTNRKVWWICNSISKAPCGNVWTTGVVNRTRSGSGCPYCSGRSVHSDGRNSMRNTHPELVSEFHPTKNGDHTPDNVKAGTNRKLHWICGTCSHEWSVGGNKRTSGSGCPACANQVVHSDGRNSMRKTHPEVASEFHPTKNGVLTADNLVAGTNKNLWWVCSTCQHEWRTKGQKRCIRGQGCPSCAGQSLHIDGRNSLANAHPDLAKEWHPSKNGDSSPENILPGTHKKFWWRCLTCDNEWRTQCAIRTKGAGCPYCAGTNNSLHSDGRNSMRTTNPLLAEEFHPTMNGDLTPDNLVAGTDRKLWWICKNCDHEWMNTGSHRANGSQGCPSCAGKAVHIDGRNSMRNTHPDLALDFHSTMNGDFTPDTVLGGSHNKFWWLCSTCEHEWQADRHSGNQCPACARQAVHSDGSNSMRNTHPKLADEFHPTKNGDLTPDNLLAGTNTRIWWKCSECSYVWGAPGNSRIDKTHQTGSNCPSCAKSGFDGSKSGYLYTLHYKTAIDEWYKIGITNKEVHYRVNQLLLSARKSKMYFDAEITILEEIHFQLGRDAEELERRIKRDMGNDELKFFPSESIDGISEFVIRHPLEYARERGWI